MRFLVGLVLSVAITAIFKKHIKKYPVVFYVISALLAALYIALHSVVLAPWIREYVLCQLQSNTLGMGFFTIVMFTGVLQEGSKLRRSLMSIRAELSIIASILTIGHVINYGESYLMQVLSKTAYVPAIRMWSLIIALVLVLLLIPLAITSAKKIRAMMNQKNWKNLQRFAYLFYGLVFAHAFIILIEPALGGSSSAAISLVLYTIVGVAYAILRINRYISSQKA